MLAYVINLARSAERRAHIIAELDETQTKYEVIEAVDGRDLDIADTSIVDGLFAATMADHPGVVGCALSHLQVYRRVLNDGFSSACILEDDVVLPADFAELIAETALHMQGADVVLLNFQSLEPCRVSTVGAVQLRSSRLLVQIANAHQALGTGCYLITREACARMVELVPPVRAAADSWAFFCKAGAIDRLRCVVPMPVIQSPAFRTTLSYYQPGSLYARVREAVASSRIPVLHQALAFRRRRHLGRLARGRTEFVE